MRIPEFPNSGNLWNPESWASESGKQLKESGIPLTIGIRNPSFTDNESDPRRGIQTAIDYLTWGEMNFHMGLILKPIASFVTYNEVTRETAWKFVPKQSHDAIWRNSVPFLFADAKSRFWLSTVKGFYRENW